MGVVVLLITDLINVARVNLRKDKNGISLGNEQNHLDKEQFSNNFHKHIIKPNS